jgi:hypothetical protein
MKGCIASRITNKLSSKQDVATLALLIPSEITVS